MSKDVKFHEHIFPYHVTDMKKYFKPVHVEMPKDSSFPGTQAGFDADECIELQDMTRCR